MTPITACDRCGQPIKAEWPHCPFCGAKQAERLPLNLPDPTPESFVPLLNSLYNLLAVVPGEDSHLDRAKYLPDLSEKVMIRRCRIEHETVLRDFVRHMLGKPEAATVVLSDGLMDLYTLSLSNALAGYAYRSVEEMICRKKSQKLAASEKARLISSMYEEYGSELASSGYQDLRADDPVDNRLMFCLALRWDNRHLKYLLAEDRIQRLWWETVLSHNCVLSENCTVRVFKRVYERLRLTKNVKSLMEKDRETTFKNTHEDLMHGYIVRLSESLDPLGGAAATSEGLKGDIAADDPIL